jgi:hypothetical protein
MYILRFIKLFTRTFSAFSGVGSRQNPLGRWGSIGNVDFSKKNALSGSWDYCFGPFEFTKVRVIDSKPLKNSSETED